MTLQPTVDETLVPQRRSFISRLWTGDVSFGLMFWVFGCIGGPILRLISPLIEYYTFSHSYILSDRTYLVIHYICFVIVNAYGVFISVGLWRSSAKYMMQNPSRRWRGGIARVFVMIACLIITTSFVNTVRFWVHPYAVTNNLENKAIVAGLNSKLPERLGPNSTIEHYEMAGTVLKAYIKIQSDVGDKQKFLDEARAKLKNRCNTKMGAFLKLGYTYEAVFSDPMSANFGSADLTAADCGM